MLLMLSLAAIAILPINIMFFAILIANKTSQWKNYFILFLIPIFVLAYCYEPKGTPDIVSYFQELKLVSSMDMSQIAIMYEDGLVVEHFVFYILGKLGLYNLLPAISTSIVYGIAYYITFDYCKSFNQLERKDIIWIFIFQLLMLPFFSLVNNIRNVSAFALLLLAFYLDFVKGKNIIKILPLYIVPCFWHSSAFLFLLIRFVLWFGKKHKKWSYFVIVLVVLVPLVYRPLVEYLLTLNIGSHGGVIGTVFRMVIAKANWYVDPNTQYNQNTVVGLYNRINRLVGMSLALCTILMKYDGDEEAGERRYCEGLKIIAATCLATNMFLIPNFWRFSAALVVGSAPLYVNFFSKKRQYKSLVKLGMLSVALMFFIMHIIWSRGITDYSKFGDNLFKDNIYTILIKIIKNIGNLL